LLLEGKNSGLDGGRDAGAAPWSLGAPVVVVVVGGVGCCLHGVPLLPRLHFGDEVGGGFHL